MARGVSTAASRGYGETARGRERERIFIVAGEHSGDLLGGRLIAAIEQRCPDRFEFHGVGGEKMAAAGLRSLFALDEIAVMGPAAIVQRLPRLLRRIRETARAVVATDPDVLVIIDAPEFTHRVARRVRRLQPRLAIVDYVSPSVWAWRPGRARRMRDYIDHVLALLPFEPEVHRRLGGPPCTYAGHPLIEHHAAFASIDTAGLAARIDCTGEDEVLVVLPGSRISEVSRLMQPFGEAVGLLAAVRRRPIVVIPTLANVHAMVEETAAQWPIRPHLVQGEADKLAAFKLARAGLAASGTVTLELALAGCPMVVAYKVDGMARLLRPLVSTPHFGLANLVLGARAFPELMQEDCVPAKLATALDAVMQDGPVRQEQLRQLARVPARMQIGGPSPSQMAADIVLRHLRRPDGAG